MAKVNSPIRNALRRRQPTHGNATVDRTLADNRVENITVIMLMAAVETVVDDFNFTAEQAERFQDLVQTRAMIKINALK